MKTTVVMQKEIAELVDRLSCAYVNLRGYRFEHLGVILALSPEPLTLAIQSNVVGALLESEGGEQGQTQSLLMLNHMLVDDELTPLGCLVLDNMNRAFCQYVRLMLDEGKDPIAELASESLRRARQ